MAVRNIKIYCNNTSCPFKDCEKRSDRIRNKARREQVTKIDMQCICERYTQYLADEINKSVQNMVKRG